LSDDQNIIIENELLRRGFTSIPNYIFGLPISSNAKLIYMALLSYAWTNHSCYPGLMTLCRDVSLTDKPVTKAIAELCEASLLEVKRRGQGKTNLYILKEFDFSVQNRRNSDSRIGGQNRRNSESRNGDSPELKTEKRRIHDKRNEKLKEEKDTHTTMRAMRAGVSVGSRFSLEECRKYAEHLHKAGEGITKPGGYATTIYRSGEADDLVEKFLSKEVVKANDISKCPDCKGVGFIYPEGIERGVVAKCKHQPLQFVRVLEEHIDQLGQIHTEDSS
jgi:Helix-turn-helix domain